MGDRKLWLGQIWFGRIGRQVFERPVYCPAGLPLEERVEEGMERGHPGWSSGLVVERELGSMPGRSERQRIDGPERTDGTLISDGPASFDRYEG